MGRSFQGAYNPAEFDFELLLERRRFERFQVDIPAMLELIGSDTVRTVFLNTENISAKGAFFSTHSQFPEGSRVRMNLVLNFAKSGQTNGFRRSILIKVTGNVLRSGLDGMAVSFDKDYQITNLRLLEKQARISLH